MAPSSALQAICLLLLASSSALQLPSTPGRPVSSKLNTLTLPSPLSPASTRVSPSTPPAPSSLSPPNVPKSVATAKVSKDFVFGMESGQPPKVLGKKPLLVSENDNLANEPYQVAMVSFCERDAGG